MNDTEIALSHSATASELQSIAAAIRELKARERKFTRVLKQHQKLSRTIGTFVAAPAKPEKGWI